MIQSKPAPPDNKASLRTRAVLIETALELFGRRGFEATSTRTLADHAGVNLAAIPYHFGSKEGLYKAVALHIASEIDKEMAPERMRLAALLQRGTITPEEAREGLHAGFERFMDLMLGSDKAARWAPFILREYMEPTAAFETLYRGFIEPHHRMACTLIGRILNTDPNSADVILRVFSLFGQVIIFRVARKAVLQRLDRGRFDRETLQNVKRIIHANIDLILSPGGTS